MCLPSEKIHYLTINQLITISDSSIDYLDENERVIGYNFVHFIIHIRI